MAEYTTAMAMLEAMASAGVSRVFVNLGSDHPAILEALSKYKLDGKKGLHFVTATHEFVGLCAAQGFFQMTGEMQAIIVHVDAGTLNMGGAIHNVSRARIPVLMVAGTSPITEENELRGGRNEFIHYLQDSRYQRNIVRDYTVYDHEVRTGKNMKQAILRASQFAKSEPQGPVYIMASRECFEEELQPYKVDARKWKPIAPVALTSESVAEIGNALLLAEHPVVITTYLGRDKDAVGELVKLCEFAGIAVIEALPAYLNFPHSHRLYQGNEWTRPLESSPLESADFVLILDCDVPWIKSSFRPPASAKIYHIDCDPLKVNMSVFHADTELSCQGHIRTALQQLNAFVARAQTPTGFAEAVAARTQKLGDRHDLYMKQLQELEAVPVADETISPHYAVSVLRSLLDDSAIVLSEGISNYPVIADCMIRNKPGTYFSSGATSLGYHGGAAIGAKLASPSSTIVAVTGDGSYLFSVPSSVHWMSRQYDAPFLTVILNNGGWKSPMATTLLVHQKGHTSKIPVDDMNITFGSHCDYAQVAVAAGAGFGATVKRVSEVEKTLKQALETVKGGRSAVVDIWVPKFKVADCVK